MQMRMKTYSAGDELIIVEGGGDSGYGKATVRVKVKVKRGHDCLADSQRRRQRSWWIPHVKVDKEARFNCRKMRLWDASFSFRFPSDVTPGSPAAGEYRYIIHVTTTFDNKMTYHVSPTNQGLLSSSSSSSADK